MEEEADGKEAGAGVVEGGVEEIGLRSVEDEGGDVGVGEGKVGGEEAPTPVP